MDTETMRNFPVLFSGILVSLCVLVSSSTAQARDLYSHAKKVGKAHGIGCGKGGFIDIKGHCWHCPKGYHHDNIFLKPTDHRVCKKTGHRTNIHGKRHSCLKPGGFGPGSDGHCYKCPKGYHHDLSKLANKKGVCYKKKKDKYSAAKKLDKNLFCKGDAFLDLIDGGTCWECPKGHPARTVHSVKSSKACTVAKCGGDGERPCLVTERIPSCDSGLIEDFIHNKCTSLKKVFCEATVAAVKGDKGSKLGLGDLSKTFHSKRSKKEHAFHKTDKRDAMLKEISEQAKPYAPHFDELIAISKRMSNAEKKLKKLFSPENICHGNPADIDKELEKLGLKPTFDSKKRADVSIVDILLPDAMASEKAKEHFFLGFAVVFELKAIAGGLLNITYVTDFDGSGGFLFHYGLIAGVTPEIGGGLKLLFYPKKDIHEFRHHPDITEGEFEFVAGAHLPVIKIGASIAFGVNSKFSKLESIAIAATGGVAPIPLPGDLVIGYIWSQPIWTYSDSHESKHKKKHHHKHGHGHKHKSDKSHDKKHKHHHKHKKNH